MKTIVWLTEEEAAEAAIVGGKGANLGKLVQAGLPVPPGFCVTTGAYQKFIQQLGLWREIEQSLKALPANLAGELIRRLITEAEMPEDISLAIKRAYADFEGINLPVAVRSSATAEDLASASFAGQQDTYLGVREAENVVKSVQLCWASLWTERAITYRQRNGFVHDAVNLAVVVQQMVASQVSGVLFTANPVTGRRDEMLINASYGLGESIVSGKVTPDSFRISNKGFALLEEKLGSKETRLDMTANRTIETPTMLAERERFCLNPQELKILHSLGNKVQKFYGSPQDIEWAFVDGKPILLQSRPITSQIDERKKTPSRLENIIAGDILEHYPEPPFPLDHSAVIDSYQQLVTAMGEYGLSLPAAAEIIKLDENGLPSILPSNPKFNWRIFSFLLTLRKALKIDPESLMSQSLTLTETKLESLAKTDVQALADLDLMNFIQEAIGITSQMGSLRFRDFIIPSIARSLFLKWMMSFSKDSRKLNVMDLLGGVNYKTARIDDDLRQLALCANDLPGVRKILLNQSEVVSELSQFREGRQYLDLVDHFIEQNGARTMKMYLPFSNRSWAERPETLMASIAVLLRSERHLEKDEVLPDDGLKRILVHIPAWLRKRFSSTVYKFQAGHIARESTLYNIEQAFVQARRGMDEAAKRAVSHGVIAQNEDVIFLGLDEVFCYLHGCADISTMPLKISRRKVARPGALKKWRGDWYAQSNKNDGETISGTSGSQGVAEGRVKIILGSDEFANLKPGDILVCPFTDPAWTPLFMLAGAVVADTGGPLSHAAIVAREYGIPAVLGTLNATSLLYDGDIVEVDGNNGVVRIIQRNSQKQIDEQIQEN